MSFDAIKSICDHIKQLSFKEHISKKEYSNQDVQIMEKAQSILNQLVTLTEWDSDQQARLESLQKDLSRLVPAMRNNEVLEVEMRSVSAELFNVQLMLSPKQEKIPSHSLRKLHDTSVVDPAQVSSSKVMDDAPKPTKTPKEQFAELLKRLDEVQDPPSIKGVKRWREIKKFVQKEYPHCTYVVEIIINSYLYLKDNYSKIATREDELNQKWMKINQDRGVLENMIYIGKDELKEVPALCDFEWAENRLDDAYDELVIPPNTGIYFIHLDDNFNFVASYLNSKDEFGHIAFCFHGPRNLQYANASEQGNVFKKGGIETIEEEGIVKSFREEGAFAPTFQDFKAIELNGMINIRDYGFR